MILHPCATCRRHLDEREALCRFCGADQGASRSSRVIDHAGRFSRAAVFAGLSACWTSSNAPPPQPPDQGASRATVAAVSVSGVVIDSNTGAPLGGVAVGLQSPLGRVAQTTTNGRGEYAFSGLAPGDYVITFQHGSGTPDGVVQRSVTVDGQPQRLDVTLQVGAKERMPIPAPYGAPPARRRVV